MRKLKLIPILTILLAATSVAFANCGECEAKDKSKEKCETTDKSKEECNTKDKSKEKCETTDKSKEECNTKDKSKENCETTCETKDAATAESAQKPKHAVEFELPDTNGKIHKLSDYKDKTIVLEWLNFDCPFVKKHYSKQNMQGLQKAAIKDGIVWLSICSSAEGKQGNLSPEDMNARAEKEGWSGTAILLDTDGTVGHAYDAKTTPHMYIIDAEGHVAYEGAIDSIRSPDSKDIEKAENYVTAALAALASDKEIDKAQTQPYGCSIKYAENPVKE